MKDMHIFDYDFHDYKLDFQPDDIYDFDFWMTVNVGDGVAGNYYQVHICTPISIKRIENKRGCFMVDQWEGLHPLITEMNKFIDQLLYKFSISDPYVI